MATVKEAIEAFNKGKSSAGPKAFHDPVLDAVNVAGRRETFSKKPADAPELTKPTTGISSTFYSIKYDCIAFR